MRRRSEILAPAGLAVLAAIALGAGGCGSTSATLDPVAQAAQATAHAGGAQMSLTGTVTLPGGAGELTLTGEGDFNFATHEGNFDFAIAGLPASAQQAVNSSSLHMTELMKSGSLYIGSPAFAGKLPNGASWMRINISRFGQALGLDPNSLASGGTNPAQYLEYLRAAGATASVVGHETVRGVDTTHYQGTLDLLKAAEAQPGVDRSQVRAAFQRLAAEIGGDQIPVDVWVDANHLLRKMQIAMTIKPGGQALQFTIQSEYHDFGPTPSVTPPPDSEVFDATAQALQNLPNAGG